MSGKNILEKEEENERKVEVKMMLVGLQRQNSGRRKIRGLEKSSSYKAKSQVNWRPEGKL